MYYENSRGDKINFLEYPYLTAESDAFDSSWEESSSGYQRTIQVDVYGKDESFAANMERLYSVIAVDAEEGEYGRLYVNDTFLICRAQSSVKSNWKGYNFAEVDLTFTAPELAWITLAQKSFYPQTAAGETTGLDFPFDFSFDFADAQSGVAEWDVEHVAASDFLIVIYGPCVNPRILINGHAYEVFTTLESGEYMVINSIEQTIYKYLSNGTTQNLFHDRGLEDSVFEPIPSGLLRINWSGAFGFDITLYLERREARW